MNSLSFCENNLSEEMHRLIKKTKAEFTNVDVTIESCLGHCEHCALGPIALANGELVTADTAHLLFERAKNIIGEREVATARSR
ncbi:MAG: DUF1450 domain-containing protein [Negativicutes bacterium]|nr:DUF1450 domain-containing protein [Negativicutes bacterium]